MAVRLLNTSTTLTDYRFRVTLDNVFYVFVLRFNERQQSWHFDLFDDNGNAIRHGVRIVELFPMLRQIATEGRPPGELVSFGTTGQQRHPGENDLGADIEFLYVQEESVP